MLAKLHFRTVAKKRSITVSFAAKLHPEWGFLSVVPSLISAARIAVISAGIGAITGALVVLKLATPGPGIGEVTLAARTLVCRSEVEQATISAPIHATVSAAHAARDGPSVAAAPAVWMYAPARTPIGALLQMKAAKRRHVERRHASRWSTFEYYPN
jgi:hypothetical protein